MTSLVVRAGAVGVFLACGLVPASAQDTRSVLLLYSEQWLGPATSLFTQGLRESLALAPDVQLDAQHLDVSRFGGEAHDRALADWLRSRYQERQPSVVLALGVPASLFATQYGDGIWPGARLLM
jgi:hypothetical protein